MNSEQNSYKFIDIHYHASPDLYQRRYNVFEAGELYKKLQGAVVLKSHLGSTSVQATIARQNGLPVFPSLVMNDISGGIHFKSILRSLAEYKPVIPSKMIVHLPTITGRSHKSRLTRYASTPAFHNLLTGSETIFNESGNLKNEFIDIFKAACDYPIILSTGHASKNEILALIDACDKQGVSALLLNQPANPLTGLNAKDLLELTHVPFVWVERTALTYLLGYQDDSGFKEVLRCVPRVIYSSDLGQTTQMDIDDWLDKSNQWFSQFQLTNERRAELCLHNPSKLLLI